MTTPAIQIIDQRETSDGWVFTVQVAEGGATTAHQVTVPRAYWERFSQAHESVDALVRASFAFLLEREPKESILREFDLPIIQQYFPDYENMLQG